MASAAAEAPLAPVGFSHDWDGTLQEAMWVDFYFIRGIHGGAQNITEAQAEFVAKNYAIVSLEKCLGEPANNTLAMFDDWAVRLKSIRPELKVLFYWSTPSMNEGCYGKQTEILEAHPEWLARADDGTVVRKASGPYLNDSIAEERDWWVSVPAARSAADGFFADTAAWPLWRGVSEARRQEAATAMMGKLDQLRRAVHPKPVIGNTLGAYPSQPDFNMEYLDHLDGACAEHMASFEQVVPGRMALIVNSTAGLLSRVWTTASVRNQTVLARTWPGPAVTPIDGLGPSWPVGTPTTPATRADAAAKWVDWAAGLYLTIATENVFWSYNWWYNVDAGVYPCPRGECEAPEAWYPVLARRPGPPLGPAERWSADGATMLAVLGSKEDAVVPGDAAPVYKRAFANVNVTLDLSRLTATLDWA